MPEKQPNSNSEPAELPAGWLPLDYSHDPVICPLLNRRLPDDPRDLDGLREYRAELYVRCERSELWRRAAWQQAKQDFRWWANAFVWTGAGMKFLPDGRQVSQPLKLTPWRHWPVDDFVDSIYAKCRDAGQSMMIPKSRDLRATLGRMIRFVHNFLFVPGWYGLVLAHKESIIDGAGAESLLPRCRSILKMLPTWQTHDVYGEMIWTTKKLLIENRVNKSFIGGTASTEEPATGMRPTEVVFDEAAKNRNFAEAWEQTAHSTKFRIAVSTYKGPGRFASLDEEGVIVAPMLYYNHPDKGRGREIRVNTNPFYPVKVGKPYVWTPAFQFDVWDEEKQAAKQTTTGVAQNVFADKTAGSSGFFDGDVLMSLRLRAESCVPEFVGSLSQEMEASPERDAAIMRQRIDLVRPVRGVGESFKWWLPLNGDRPDQSLTYLMFADISQGRGASNSVLAIGCMEYMRVVGMYAAADFEPGEFARQMCAIGLWIGGNGGVPLMGWEVNGPGEGLDRAFMSLRYPRLWAAQEGELGWRSGSGAKEEAANTLAMALQTDSLRIDEPMFYREAADWAYLTSSTIGCTKTAKDPHAKATHGDRVVAVMGLNLMMINHTKPVPQSRMSSNFVDMNEWKKAVERMRAMQ